MSIFKSLFNNTALYGLAMVIPRAIAFVLLPLYTDQLSTEMYSQLTIIMSYFIFANVMLSYGMETTFFRFYTKTDNATDTIKTSFYSVLATSLLALGILLFWSESIGAFMNVKTEFVRLFTWTLILDAIAIIPFAWLRATSKPLYFAGVKIMNTCINLGLNVFFLIYLKKLADTSLFWKTLYEPNQELYYVLLSMVIASAITLVLLLPFLKYLSGSFSTTLWKQMLKYTWPILVAGLSFSINETLDKILLSRLLPENEAEVAVGAYGACYKLAVFMTLFATAFRLGIEPFFFSYAKKLDAPKMYALITKYFVLFGSLILIVVTACLPVLKVLFIKNTELWGALSVVPLILIANLCLGIYHNLSVWYKVTDRTHFGALISVVAAILTITTNILLIPRIGYVGSAIATLIAYASMMFLSLFIGRKYYPIPYDFKRISLYLLVSIGGSLFIAESGNYMYLYSVPLVILYVSLIFVLERKEIFRLIKQ